MFHKFPYIENIKDILPAIKDREEFYVCDYEGTKIINYHYVQPDTFNSGDDEIDLLRRECKGITFNSDGKIIRRSYHKFKNLGEDERYSSNNIDLNIGHIVLDKIDGSMCSSVFLEDRNVLWTKMGETEQAVQAIRFIDKSDVKYNNFIAYCRKYNMTPIFEWISPYNRIIIEYQNDDLILTAMRDLYTGEYIDYQNMSIIAEQFNVPVVKAYWNKRAVDYVDDLDKFTQEIIESTGIEGVVVRFCTGEMIKLKCEEYINAHNSLSSMFFEKDIVRLILEEKTDDILPFISDDVKNKLEEFESKFWKNVEQNVFRLCKIIYLNYIDCQKDKKNYATNFVVKHENRIECSILFNGFSLLQSDISFITKELHDFILVDVIKLILKYTSSSTKLKEVKYLYGNLEWNFATPIYKDL